MVEDKIFAEKIGAARDFDFGAKTAAVFDDMLVRSVPFYIEMQHMIAEFAKEFVQPGSNVYDLGCSTGTTFLALDPELTPTARFVGIDSSPEMLKKAKAKLEEAKIKRPYELKGADLDGNDLEVENASLVIMNLTLQFVRPMNRARLIKKIANGTNEKGAIILIEKVLGNDSELNRLFIKKYYDFKKRNGYSELEISQKREALENILIPYRAPENEALLLENGYRECEIFFKWYNFCGFVAVK